MQPEKKIPKFDRRIFWDVDFDHLYYADKESWIFERGDVEDIRQCRRYYGDMKVSKALLNAKYLSEPILHLASAVINKPVRAFRCYKLKQLNQEPSTF